MNPVTSTKLISFGLMCGIMACSEAELSESEKAIIENPPDVSTLLVPVEVTVSQLSDSTLAELTGGSLNIWGDGYEGNIYGCLSGFTRNVTAVASDIRVMDGDKGCRFRMKRLVLDSETFDFPPDSEINEGDTVSIRGSFGSLVTVRLADGFDPVISGPQSVVVQFGVAEKGSSQLAAASTTAGISVTGDDRPINLDVGTVHARVDATDGAGVFSFALDCATPVVIENGLTLCDGVPLDTLTAGVLPDTWNGDVDAANCRDIVVNGGAATGVPYVSGSSNGGLSVSNLRGPAPLYSYPNLILAIAKPEYFGGCKYFQVSVEPP